MLKYIDKENGFMSSSNDYKKAQTVLVGIPMDYTVSFKPGSRFAPQMIRNMSYGLEDFSFHSLEDLRDFSFYDAGDIDLAFGNVTESLQRIRKTAEEILKDDKLGFFIGGEHLVSWPLIDAYSDKYKDLAVIHFDAHADLRKEYLGEKNSHATVMYQVAEKIGGKNLYQFGIRSGDKEEYLYGKEKTNLFIDAVFPFLEEAIEEIGDRPVYLTIDIDVIDPGYAPGTGTPEAGGISPKELFAAILSMKKLNIVGADLVEVSPINDSSDITSILAAKIIREYILNYSVKKA